MKKYKIKNEDDLKNIIDEFGFLPFFSHEIPGFSIEEMILPSLWFSDKPGPWEWKGPVISEMKCAYGKFFRKKAGFISKTWFYDFANVRRDGYDFDARFEDGLATYNEQYLYNIIASRHSILSKEAKAVGGYVKPRNSKDRDAWEPRKGFDTLITRLQMECYVITSNFEYEQDKNGNFYGWGIARYATPEEYLGKTFSNNVYKRTPEESYKRIYRHLHKLFPEEDEFVLDKFIRG